MPGVPERRSHDYLRYGTTPTSTPPSTSPPGAGDLRDDAAAPRRKSFARFLNQIDASVSAGLRGATSCSTTSSNALNAVDSALARPPPTVHVPFHPDLQLLAQPRRALVRRTDHEMDQAWQPPLRPRPHRLDPHLDHQLERPPQTVCLAQNRRRDPRQLRRLLPDQRLRSRRRARPRRPPQVDG